MSLPVNRPLNIIRVAAHLADSGTAGSAFAVAPARGKVVRLGSVVYGVVGTANNALTAKIAATSITIPTWTQLTSGSAAGDVSEVIPTGANTCNQGDNIEFIS